MLTRLLSCAAVLCLAGVASAAQPVDYHVTMTPVLSNPPANPDPILNGATLEIIHHVDVTGALGGSSPQVDAEWGTFYALGTNYPSNVSLQITGSAAHDGVYPATNAFKSIQLYSNRKILMNDPVHDSVLLAQRAEFAVGGYTLIVDTPEARFADLTFYQGTGQYLPKPFKSGEVTWGHGIVQLELNAAPYLTYQLSNVSGFAVAVPEPHAVALIALGTIGLARLRRS